MASSSARSLPSRHTLAFVLLAGAACVGVACAHAGSRGNPTSGAGGAAGASDRAVAEAASASADPGIAGTFEDVVSRQRVPLARTCWEPEMAVTRAPRARAEVDVTTADGRVVKVEVKGVTPGLAACLESSVRRWQVPKTGPSTHTFVLSFVGQS